MFMRNPVIIAGLLLLFTLLLLLLLLFKIIIIILFYYFISRGFCDMIVLIRTAFDGVTSIQLCTNKQPGPSFYIVLGRRNLLFSPL